MTGQVGAGIDGCRDDPELESPGCGTNQGQDPLDLGPSWVWICGVRNLLGLGFSGSGICWGWDLLDLGSAGIEN